MDASLVLDDGRTRIVLDERSDGNLTLLVLRPGMTALDFFISPSDLSNAQGLANFLIIYLKKHGRTL